MTAVHCPRAGIGKCPWERQNAAWTDGQDGRHGSQLLGKTEPPPPPSTLHYHHHKGGGGSFRLLTYFSLSNPSKCPKCCSDAPSGDSAGQPGGQPGQPPAATAVSLGQRHPEYPGCRSSNSVIGSRVRVPNGHRRSCNHRPLRARPLLRLIAPVATGPRSWNVVDLSAQACIPAALLVPAPLGLHLPDHGPVNLDGLCRLGGLYHLEGVGKKNGLYRPGPPLPIRAAEKERPTTKP